MLIHICVLSIITLLTMTSSLHAERDEILVMAHRGGLGLWPENTIHGYRKALEAGADVLEIDVWLTRDGVVVVNHDRTVDRTTDGSGPIRDFTLDELKQLDAGYRWSEDDTYPYRGAGHTIPTLDEVLSSFPEARFNIDLKENSDALIDSLCALIDTHDAADRLMIASFHQDVLHRFRERCPGTPTSAGSREIARFLLLSRLRLTFLCGELPFRAFQVPLSAGPISVVTRTFVEAAHRCGVEVHPWTVNDPDDMRRLIDLGVDGIITDYPDRLVDILRR